MLLVCHFLLGPDDVAEFRVRAGRAVALLGARPGCRSVALGRAVDTPGAWVLSARFDSVTAYRRSLAPFEVREHVAPLLAQCLTAAAEVPTTFEVLLEHDGTALREHPGLLAEPFPVAAEGGGDDR